MKIDLYIDFDGVILDTIDITYRRLEEAGISPKDTSRIVNFYKCLDWDGLFKESKPIKNSLNNIKTLMDSNLFNICVLSHVVSDTESIAKKKYLKEKLPTLKVITITQNINKCDAVNCKNAILVDDYMENLKLWNEKGEIPVKFSDKGKVYDFMTISSLDMLISKYNEIVKLIK